MLKYDISLDGVGENTSHAQMIEVLGSGKDVLDVGCATGYLAQAMSQRGYRVSGVEFDAASAEVARPHLDRLVVGDLQTLDLVAELGEEQFDTLVLGDVLEHLVEPVEVLRRALPLLKPGGSVVISVPNVAHGSVRLALLQGSWTYRDLGLLDATHLRFFTRASLEEMLRDAGLLAVEVRRTTADPLATEVTVDPARLPDGVLEWVRQDQDAWTYQFVVRAVRADAEGRLAQLTSEAQQASQRADELSRRVEDLQAHLTRAEEARAAAEEKVGLIEATRTMRLTRLPRRVWARWRATRR